MTLPWGKLLALSGECYWPVTTGVEHAAVKYRPRLLSDNGSCYISKELAEGRMCEVEQTLEDK